MVAERHVDFVPAGYLIGASCQLPNRMPGVSGQLSRAEWRVAKLVAEGYSNKEIAAELDRAESTIKNQLGSILEKCALQSRCQLIVLLLTGRRPRSGVWLGELRVVRD